MANVIFNIELGVGLPLIGLGMMIFRVYDAFLDPFVGNLSDNTRTRWGRRRPFIFLGAILCSLSFPAIWFAPANWGEIGLFTYFVISSLVFFTCFTIFVVPYETLSAELSPDYHERTSVVAYKSAFGSLATLALGWVFAITQLPIFSSTMQGMRWAGVAIGLMFLVMGLLPAIFCRERFTKVAKQQRTIGFAESIKLSFKNRPFLILLGILVLITLGNNLVVSLGQYLNIYYVFNGAMKEASVVQGYFTSISLGTSLATIPLATWASKRLGKRKLILITLGFTFVGTLSKWFFYTPEHPYWQLIVAFLLGLGGTGFWIGLVALIGDVADHDELNNHARREGSLTSIYTWVFKFALAITLFLGNVILHMTGFVLEFGGNQTPETFFWMRVAFVGITSFSVLICFWLIHIFPITEDSAYETRSILEKRRGRN